MSSIVKPKIDEGELDMLAQTKIPEIVDGVTVVRRFSADDRMHAMAISREKAVRDEISALAYARKEGIAAGRAEGIAEGKQATLDMLRQKLRAEGMGETEINRLLTLG